MSGQFRPVRDLGLSALAGMRSWSAPAWLSYVATRDPGGLEGTPFGILASRKALAFTVLSALGESLVDKTPLPPRRTHPVLLTWRVCMGAFVGAAVFARERRSPLAGAILGGVAGAASTYASYELRRRAVRKLGWPDLVVAVLEEGLVQGAGWGIARAQLRGD
ncbi:MAG: DUF4126 family protein [Chloroflexia bacterium]